ncbi:50S ribosomal protein L6, partial [bacterium F11]
METQVEKIGRKKKSQVLSRLGRKPVVIPDGVKVTIDKSLVKAEGKRGNLSWSLPSLITAKIEEKTVVLSPKTVNSETKAFHGLSRKLILNMIE